MFGDLRGPEAAIQIAFVRRVEDEVEASIEEKRNGEVYEAMVPLIGRPDAPCLRDARGRNPVDMKRVQQNAARRV